MDVPFFVRVSLLFAPSIRSRQQLGVDLLQACKRFRTERARRNPLPDPLAASLIGVFLYLISAEANRRVGRTVSSRCSSRRYLFGFVAAGSEYPHCYPASFQYCDSCQAAGVSLRLWLSRRTLGPRCRCATWRGRCRRIHILSFQFCDSCPAASFSLRIVISP